MSAFDFNSLKEHVGHEIVVVQYEYNGFVDNVAVECETCWVVLLDYNNEAKEDWPGQKKGLSAMAGDDYSLDLKER